VNRWMLQQREQRMPRRSLLFLCVAIGLAVAPLAAKVPFWACALLLAAAFGRLLAEKWLGRWSILLLGVGLFAAGIGTAMVRYHTLVGLEPGTVLMLVLLSLKFLEAKSTRDFRVLVLLGYFLALTTLFFSQDFIVCIYIGGVFAVLTGALVHLQLAGWGEAENKLWPATRLSLLLLAQATPVVILLFLFFPRFNFGFQINNHLFDMTGMSDEMKPGGIESVVTSTKVAFRADFPDEETPPTGNLYWRGVVLWNSDGLNWTRGYAAGWKPEPLGGKTVRQRITLEPHGRKWLFALDRPTVPLPHDAQMVSGDALESRKPVNTALHYEVVSRTESREATLPPLIRATALRTQEVSPRARQLALSWRTAAASDREVVDQALRYFHKEHFLYTLAPGGYSGDSLDEFLFRRRTGFCEHYAGAFATLMRVAGIPSRVVLGYLGGNAGYGGYVIVPESDAHAWAEVWLPGHGWLRVDPTIVVAPERVNVGLESYLESAAATSSLLGATTGAVGGFMRMRDVLRDIRLAWDGVNYQWDLRVMGYDEEAQHNFFTVTGLGNPGTMRLILRTFLWIGIALTLLASWMNFRARKPADKVRALYDKFCRRAASAGVQREQWEGPLDFRERVLQRFPGRAAEVENIFRMYIRLRYGADEGNGKLVGDFSRAVRGFYPL